MTTAVADIAANAIHRAALYEQTELRPRRLDALSMIDKAITSSLDLEVTLNIVLDQVTLHLRVDAAAVLLFNPCMQTRQFFAGRGLRGEEIPFAARPFTVVDVWDALRSDRPYRKALPEERAREYINASSELLFDPQVAKTFLQIVA